jgi:sucrose phosphorylase
MDVLLFYIEHGARYIRLDAIAYLWKEVGTSCIHLEQTHIVIQLMRAVLDAVAPNVIIITETNVPHAENVSYFGDGYNEAQMVYNFTLPPLLFYTMQAGNCAKLRNWVNTLNTPSERTTFFNFTASHDGIGVRPVEGILDDAELAMLIAHVEACGGRVSYKQNTDGSQSPYELNITYIDAITDPSEPENLQARRFLLSQAVALSMAGVPALYIHSLLGTRNDIQNMQESGHNRRINRAKLNEDAVGEELVKPDSFRGQVFGPFCELIRRRIGHAAFHPNGAQAAIDLGSDAVFALLRTAPDGSERVLCLFNITGRIQTIDASDYVTGTAQDIISGDTLTGDVVLQPYQAMWLAL